MKALLVSALIVAALSACCAGAPLPASSSQASQPSPASPAQVQQQPSPGSLPSPGQSSASGAVRGKVEYTDQSPLAGAQLLLTPASGPPLHAISEADGSFVLQQVPAGAFTLRISGDDVEPTDTAGEVPANGALELPTVILPLRTVHTEVAAITEREAAKREVKAEEGQRILHAIPNFLVTYDAEPVPLSSAQKFRLSTRTLVDPVNIGVSAAIAGGEQASGSYPGFGRGFRGYARRFGASVGDSTSAMLLTGGVMPSLFHQDPRYFYRGTGSRGSRLVYVLKQTVEQKGDNGRWQFAWSNTLGDMGSALISDTYYPRQGHRWGPETAQLFGLSIVSTGVSNLLQEFFLGRITTRRAN